MFTGPILAIYWVFWKKLLSLEMGKNNFYLEISSKKMPFLHKICPRKRSHAPNAWNRPWFNVCLVFNTLYLHKHWTIASSIYNIGAIRKFYCATSTFNVGVPLQLLLFVNIYLICWKPKIIKVSWKVIRKRPSFSQGFFHHLYYHSTA